MEERRLVVLFGDSLLMDTVEANLEDTQELGVMRIHATVPNVGERLKALSPDVVIFDFDAPHLQFIIPFLREQPGVPLLGLDVACSKVVAMSSQHYTTVTANDLTQLILSECLLSELSSYDSMWVPPTNGQQRITSHGWLPWEKGGYGG